MGFANDFAGHEANYREALAIRREMGERAGTAMNLAGVAIPVYFRGDFAGAQELAEEAFDIASHINHQESKAMALAVLGLVAAVHEDYPGGRQLLTEARSLAVDGVKASWSELGLSMVACGEGDYASAKHHLQKMMEGQPALGGYYAAPFLHVLALINIHEGDAVSGIEIISLTRHHPEIGVMSATSEVWPLVSRLQARARADLGDDVYNAAWERGMALDYDKVLARLFDEISTTAESADGLLTDQMQAANQNLIAPLTQREHEILFLIAQGLSNRQIAEQLVIAVSTVKRHVNNCYGKLDVSSRTQAVIKAQNLKLV
jgi:ATP/maltotriose-dependent transcriptional regulator MalT